MNEEKLLKEIENDPQKFGKIYEVFYKKIFGYVFRRTLNYDAAKDFQLRPSSKHIPVSENLSGAISQFCTGFTGSPQMSLTNILTTVSICRSL